MSGPPRRAAAPAPLADGPASTEATDNALADFFRDADATSDIPLLWRLSQQGELTQALSGLFHGPAALVQLRLWVFLALAGQGEASLPRERIDEQFHALRPEALDTVLKRFRDTGLLAWDETQRSYTLPPLAQRVAALLSPLASHSPVDEDPEGGELAALLGQVVGANTLGALDAGQVQLLHAQLARLHGEFADAIASGSEFRLRKARARYDRATKLIDRASDAITAIITNARGHIALERAARGLGQAQSRLLAMASQFNRALQQVDRQRVTLGTTGITSTDVKRWLQTLAQPQELLEGALGAPLALTTVAPHELLDVVEAEFERDRPTAALAETLPEAQSAPAGSLAALALPPELEALSTLLGQWHSGAPDAHDVAEALLGTNPEDTRYAQLAYKAQLLPLLGDPQAAVLPGVTGELARQPWRVTWEPRTHRIRHPEIALLSRGRLVPADGQDTTAPATQSPEQDPDTRHG